MKRRKKTNIFNRVTVDLEESEYLGETSPDVHHHISHSRNFPIPLSTWITEDGSDIAMHVGLFILLYKRTPGVTRNNLLQEFVPKLQDHLLHRLREPGTVTTPTEFSWHERHEVVFQANRIFRHKVLRINYTSYDLRRCQDSVNPRTQANIMLPAVDLDPSTGTSASGHPFTYARILGVFHAEVLHNKVGQRLSMHIMEFLWVRRYQLDRTHKGGFKSRRLYRVSLIPETDKSAFGFVDPDDVIRGVHLIPAFAHGTSDESSAYMSKTVLWKSYYVNL